MILWSGKTIIGLTGRGGHLILGYTSCEPDSMPCTMLYFLGKTLIKIENFLRGLWLTLI